MTSVGHDRPDASTYPVEVVQADRFLERRKTEKNLQVNESWQDPVKALLNYPEVVKKMTADLDWTVALGEAVVADQSAVLEAVQRFRRHAGAGSRRRCRSARRSGEALALRGARAGPDCRTCVAADVTAQSRFRDAWGDCG